MREQMMPNSSVEKDSIAEARISVEDFFEAYKEKYENSETAIANAERYLGLLNNGDYAGVLSFLQRALTKYEKMRQYTHKTAIDMGEELDEEAVISYENMAEKTKAAITALEALG